MGKIIFSMLGKVEDILNEVRKHGENDGVCTRKYITPYRKVDEDGRKWDCLAIGICNEEPNRLLTFWQDENDDDFHTEDYLSLTNTEQVEIFNTLSGSIDFWDEEGTWSNTLFCKSVSFKK